MRRPETKQPSTDWGYLLSNSDRPIQISAEDAYYRRITCDVSDLPKPEFACSSCGRGAHPRSSVSSISMVHNKGQAGGCKLSSPTETHLSAQDREKGEAIKHRFFTEKHLLETFFVLAKLCGERHEKFNRLAPVRFEKAILAIATNEPWFWKNVDKYKISMRAASGILIRPNDRHTIMWQMENGRGVRLVKNISFDGLSYKAYENKVNKSKETVSISENGFRSNNAILDDHPDKPQAEIVCQSLVERFIPQDKAYEKPLLLSRFLDIER